MGVIRVPPLPDPELERTLIGPAARSFIEPTAIEFAPFADGCDLSLSRPLRYDMCVYRGDSGAFRVTVTDSDGNPVNVSAATWDADIRERHDESELASLTVIPVPGQPSQVDVVLSAAASASLPVGGPWVWDLEMTLGGTVQTLIGGQVTVTADVSREYGG